MRRRQRDLLRLAREHGWSLERCQGGHWRLRHRSGHVVIASFTSSDGNDLRVLKGCLRRAVRQAEHHYRGAP